VERTTWTVNRWCSHTLPSGRDRYQLLTGDFALVHGFGAFRRRTRGVASGCGWCTARSNVLATSDWRAAVLLRGQHACLWQRHIPDLCSPDERRHAAYNHICDCEIFGKIDHRPCLTGRLTFHAPRYLGAWITLCRRGDSHPSCS